MQYTVKYKRCVPIQYNFMSDGTSSVISKRFSCILKANTLLYYVRATEKLFYTISIVPFTEHDNK